MRLRTRYTQRLPVAPGLRLDIPMFEGSGTKVLDVSGKGNHGTITDAVWTRDENGVAMSFNGTSAYIDCGNDPSLNITDAITIEAWVKRGSIGSAQTIAMKRISGGDMEYYMRFEIANTIAFGTYDGHYHQVASISTITSTSEWNHLAGVFTGTHYRVYINGALDNSVADNTKLASGTGKLSIGQKGEDTGDYFNGTLDEVRIYAVALTAEQIKRRYEQTKRDYVRAS